MLFKDIVGQSYLKRRLIESAKNGRVPHAQLFAGIEGSGNLALALAYAQYLNCGNPSDNDSCGVCPSCLKFKALAHPDLHFVFPIVRKDKEDCDAYLSQFRNAVTKNPYITNTEWVKTIRNESKTAKIYDSESAKIIKDLSYKSYEGGYKYVVIWQPEKMETGTANKLLKVIEEPSEKSVILLISNEPDRIIGTILSR